MGDNSQYSGVGCQVGHRIRGIGQTLGHLAAATILFMAAGCVPIPTTLGHGASVLSTGSRGMQSLSGGFKYHLDRADESFPYPVVVDTGIGLGGGLQGEYGMAGLNFYPSLTWQLIGERRESPVQRSAFALNAGGSYGLEAGYSAFVGAIASRPFGQQTWYVAYRRHYGGIYDDTPTAKRYIQDIAFLGVEWSPSISMEVFFTWTTEHDNDHERLPADGIGFNFFRWKH